MDWQINETNLKFVDKLGSGSCGDVHRVVWTKRDGTQVEAAAKKFKKSSKKKDIKAQTKELNLLRKLKHPNIVEFFCAVLSPITIIVTEFAQNGSLFEYLKEHASLPINQVYDWALQASHAVKYIHDRDVIHRDIKSGNFVISKDNVLKLCDFGIAKNVVKTVCTDFELGTIPWMAPETFVELKLTKASDVYSLSIVIWEMLSGKIPYENRGFANIIWSVQIHKLRPDIPESCPLALRHLLEVCWSEEANRRPKAVDMVCALQNMQKGFKSAPASQRRFPSDAPCNHVTGSPKDVPIINPDPPAYQQAAQNQMAKAASVKDTKDAGSCKSDVVTVPIYNPPCFQSTFYYKHPPKDFVISFTDPSMSPIQKVAAGSKRPTHIVISPNQVTHMRGQRWHTIMRYLQVLSCLVVLGLVVCLLLHCSTNMPLSGDSGSDWMT